MRSGSLKLMTTLGFFALIGAGRAEATMTCHQLDKNLVIVAEEVVVNSNRFLQRPIYQSGIAGNILISNPVLVTKEDTTEVQQSPVRKVTYKDLDSILEIVGTENGELVGHASGHYWKLQTGKVTPLNPDGGYVSKEAFDPKLAWTCSEN